MREDALERRQPGSNRISRLGPAEFKNAAADNRVEQPGVSERIRFCRLKFAEQTLSLRRRGRVQKMDNRQCNAPRSQILAAFLGVTVKASDVNDIVDGLVGGT